MSDLSTAGFGLAALAHLALAGYLSRAAQPQPAQPALTAPAAPSRLVVAALLATSAWAVLELASDRFLDLAWPIAAAGLDLVRYALWLALMLVLGGLSRPGPRRRRVPLVAAALVVLAAALLAQRVLTHTFEDAPTQTLLIAWLALPLTGLYLGEQLFRSLPNDMRWHAKPLYLGLAVVFAFDVFMISEALMFGQWDPHTRAARGLVHTLAVPVLLVGARRRGDWVERLRVSRTVAMHSATLVAAGVYLLVLSAVGYYVRDFGGSWGRGLQLSLVFAALAFLVALAVSGSLRSRARVFLAKHFFSYRFDYREQWLRFTAMLSAAATPQQVGEQVIRGLAAMVECAGGSLWTRPAPDRPFVQAVRWNAPRIDVEEPADSAFAHLLRERAWVVNLDEHRTARHPDVEVDLPAWLLGSAADWLVVPLLAGEDLLGFVVLGKPRAKAEVNWEVLDLLKTAGRQAASTMAQMQATEALLEARKFEAFNRMSAFVVHDLKNIVTQLSLMLKNAERLHDNREFQQDMLLTVASSLDKMRRLMLQLRDGATPTGSTHGVELDALAARLAAQARARGRALELLGVERLSTRGHEERLERVLGHLVQNAFDATPPEGRVWIGVARHGGQAKIEIGDTGTGMSEEFVQTRLFKPFSSTKRGGMGVGSYESAQYVRELGGSLDVKSRPGEGTLITVLLPLFEREHDSDLMPLDAAR